MPMAGSIRDELINAGRLFRLKLRDARKAIYVTLVTASLVTLVNLVVALQWFGDTPEMATVHYFPDYSVFLLMLAPIMVAVLVWQEATGKNSIYPQTDLSRFLSAQALSLFLVFLALCFVLILYVLLFVLSRVIGLWYPIAIIGLYFNPGFLLSGFLAAFIYLAMVTTVISFIAQAVKAFKLYAVIPATGIALFYLLYPAYQEGVSFPFQGVLNGLRTMLSRLVDLILEPKTLGLFVLACSLIGIAFLVTSFAIKRSTLDDRDTERLPWMLAVVFVPYIALTLFVGASLYTTQVELHSPTVERVIHLGEGHIEENNVLVVPIWSMMNRIQKGHAGSSPYEVRTDLSRE